MTSGPLAVLLMVAARELWRRHEPADQPWWIMCLFAAAMMLWVFGVELLMGPL